jgi:branched-chain amino acid transport system substrate-binding protein
MRRFLLLAALASLTMLPARAAEGPYVINAIVSLTGPAAFLGRGEGYTLGIAEKYINATGGIRGTPVKIVVTDDTSSPTTAVQLASQLVARKVPLFIGPGFGATCSAVLPLVENGPVMYCMSNVIHPPAGSYAFSYSPSTKEINATAFRYMKAKGIRKLGLIATTDSSGQDGEVMTVENLRSPEFKDMQLVATEHMNVTDLSVNAQVARIKAAGAQAIDAQVTGTPYGTLLRSVQEVGFEGMVQTTGGNVNKTQMEQYAQFIPKDMILVGQPYSAIGQVPAQVRLAKTTFLDQMHQAGVAVPDATQWIAWDPTMIIVSALRKLGTEATAKQVRDYILTLHDWPGVNGFYDFRRGDQRGIEPRSNVVVRWDKSVGDFVTISKPGGVPF